MNWITLKRTLNFFDKDDKKTLFFLLILNLITSIFEILGIASIMPFVGLMSDPEYFSENKYFIYVRDVLQYTNAQAIFISGVMVVSMFILSNISNAYTFWKTIQFSADQTHKISCMIMDKYLSQPYKFFVESDIAAINKNILDEAGHFAEAFVLPVLQVISKIIILFSISLLLVSVNYEIFFASLFSFILIYFLVYKSIRDLTKKYGDERLVSNDKRFKSVNDSLNSIKDVKYYSAEKHFLKSFSKAQKKFSISTAKNMLLSTLPRYIIEILAFGILFSVILYIIHVNNTLVDYLPLLAIFILAAYRVLPLLQHIFRNMISLNFNFPVLEILDNIMKLPSDNEEKLGFTSNENKEIEFKNVSFAYNRTSQIFNKLNFNIKQSSVTAIIGSTGIGKTTIIDLLLGFYSPSSGEIIIGGKDTRDKNNFDKTKLIGYVSQNIALIDDTIANNIAFGIPEDDINYELVEKVIKQSSLKEFIDTLDNGYSTRIGERGVKLSGGQCQRIGIARALYLNPNILIFDEATNALDSITEEKIFKSIKTDNKNITIIVITHRLSSLKLCDKIFLLKKNEIINLDNSNVDTVESVLETLRIKK